VVDAGTLVHPDGALALVEGSALWGLSMTLNKETEFVKGQVKDRNFDSYTPLRIGDVLELDIELIETPMLRWGSANLSRPWSRPPSAMRFSRGPEFGCATCPSGWLRCSQLSGLRETHTESIAQRTRMQPC